MDDEITTQQEVVEEVQATEQEQAQPEKKSKEENFDGVVRKLNAKQKELKQATSRVQELESQIAGNKSEATNSEKSELQELRKAIEDLKNERTQEVFQSKVSKGLEQANIDPKFQRLAINTLKEIAEDKGFDLKDSQDLKDAITLFAQGYPELLAKKPKQTGIPNGQTQSDNAYLSSLDGDMEKYMSLSKEQKQAIKKKVFQS